MTAQQLLLHVAFKIGEAEIDWNFDEMGDICFVFRGRQLAFKCPHSVGAYSFWIRQHDGLWDTFLNGFLNTADANLGGGSFWIVIDRALTRKLIGVARQEDTPARSGR